MAITKGPLLRAVLALVLGTAALAACDDDSNGTRGGIASLGSDFLRAFNQDPNDEPLDASDLELRLTPRLEPFNP